MLDAHVVKRRRDFTVDAHLRIAVGGCLALFGASGAGKSTVLSCSAGIEQPDDGVVRLGDLQMFPPPLPLHRRPVGYLTQEPHLFPHLSVEDNIAFGLGSGRTSGEAAWLKHLRDSMGLSAIWEAPAAQISGGQARRVALARMLARRPPLVLLDEPFGGLDRQLVRELIESLLEWRKEIEFILIVIDHQAEILERLCPHAAVISHGKILQEGSWTSIRAEPADPAVRKLLEPL
jgi:molybdate transport system ATP-binding protein